MSKPSGWTQRGLLYGAELYEAQRKAEAERKAQEEEQAAIAAEQDRLLKIAQANYQQVLAADARMASQNQFGSMAYTPNPYTTSDYKPQTGTVTSSGGYYVEPTKETLFDIIDPEVLSGFTEQVNTFLDSGHMTPEEAGELNKMIARANSSDGITSQSIKNRLLTYTRDYEDRGEFADTLKQYGITDYQPNDVSSIQEAKQAADSLYMRTLENLKQAQITDGQADYTFGKESIALIDRFINQGALDFDSRADADTYAWASAPNKWETDLDFVRGLIKESFDIQKDTMQDYLRRADIYTEQPNSPYRMTHPNAQGRPTVSSPQLVTGTPLDVPAFREDNLKVLGGGLEVGEYNLMSWNDPPPTGNSLLDVLSIGLSIAFPAFAPLINATNTLVQGGDLEDALKSAGKAYVGGKIGELANSEIIEGFDKLGVDITTLPQSAQNVILDTSKAVLQGDSGTEEFKSSATGEILDAIKPDFDFKDSDFNLNTPEFIKDFGDAVYGGIKAVGDVAEEGYKAVEPILEPVGDLLEGAVDLTADVFEPVVDVVDEGLDYFGEKVVDPALQAGSDVLSDAEDVVKAGGRVVDDTLLQPVKEGVEYVVDVAQELRDSLPEFEAPEFSSLDIDLPEMPDIDLPDIDLNMPELPFNMEGMFAQPQKTPTNTEQLFDKELFKFDTEIKSTQEMLSPMMNLRKYG